MRRGLFIKPIILVVGALLPAAAWANYSCIGTIEAVSLNPGGTVTVTSDSSGLGTFHVCQIGGSTNGVEPEVCKAIFATLTVAKASGMNVQWYFNDSLSCVTHASWTWLTGWYHGPTLLE